MFPTPHCPLALALVFSIYRLSLLFFASLSAYNLHFFVSTHLCACVDNILVCRLTLKGARNENMRSRVDN